MTIMQFKTKVVKLLRKYGLKPQPMVEEVPAERLEKIRKLAALPLKNDQEIKRVEICVLKYKEDPEVINPAMANVIHHTSWPFKLNIYDNRPNLPNMAKVWNRLVRESTCDYICFLDSDAYVPKLDPCWLTRLMESIDEVGVVVPLGDNITGINKASQAKQYPSAQLQTGIWTGFCFLLKKEIGLREPFDEEFFIYGQDSEWASRLSEKFGGVIIREDVLVHHLRHYSTKKAEKKGEIDKAADMQYAHKLLEKKIRLTQ